MKTQVIKQNNNAGKTLSKNLKEYRQRLGVGQNEFSLEIGLTNYDEIERGKIRRGKKTNPSLNTLIKIANGFNVPVCELLKK